MSYEDTNCPCGHRKERDTMLCADCMTAFKDHPSMKGFLNADGTWSIPARRQSAIILVTLARKRLKSATLK
jgi:hypothetical protein